jgi:hypothetical protein
MARSVTATTPQRLSKRLLISEPMPILTRYNETGAAVLSLEADGLGRIGDEMRNTFATKPFPNGDRHFTVFEHHWSKTFTRDYRRGTSSRDMSQRAVLLSRT